jgi:hypothetical protein
MTTTSPPDAPTGAPAADGGPTLDYAPRPTRRDRLAATTRQLATLSARGVVVGWLLLGAAVIFATQLTNTMWAFANPAPHHWDNAEYLNLAYTDLWAARFGGPSKEHYTGWRGVYDSLVNADPNRPPAFRVASLPLLYLGTRVLPTLRAVSLIVFWATLLVMYQTAVVAVPGPAGKAAGAIAAILASLYLEVGWSVRVYGTEYTLYFAVALMLWCFARAARADRPGWTWLWLGLALGIGILSKMSFLFLAGPVGLLVGVLSLTKRLPGLPFGRLCGAAVIGAAMAFPWYRYHLFSAYHYGQDMTQFSRHSLNEHGLRLLGKWLALHTNEGVGPRAGAILLGLAVAALLTGGVRWWRWIESGQAALAGRWYDFSPAGWTVLIALVQGLPLLAFQLLFSNSDNARHMTPAYLPLTIAAAVAAGSAGVLAAWWSWPLLVAAAIPAVQQVGHDFVPLTTTADDVWDWTPLYDLCKAHGMMYPYIGRVGNAGQFNDPAIVAPWFARGDRAYSNWLWRQDYDGPFDWPKLQAKLADRTVVVTAPGFQVPTDHSMLADPLLQDNAYNQAVADHMVREPGWLPPERFDIGVVNRSTVWVFLRKSAVHDAPSR